MLKKLPVTFSAFRLLNRWGLFLLAGYFIALSCNPKQSQKSLEEVLSSQESIDTAGLHLIPYLDTVPTSKLAQSAESLLKEAKSHFPTSGLTYYYLKALSHENEEKALIYLDSMKPQDPEWEYLILKENRRIFLEMGKFDIVSYEEQSELLELRELAEEKQSRFLYKIYDELAREYFLNGDFSNSLEYAQLYYEAHPYPSHPIVEQRYFDIRFLLGMKMGDMMAMDTYLHKAQDLALQINDSLTLARTYDYESQYYYYFDQKDKSLESNKKAFNLFKKLDHVNLYNFTNLGLSFVHSHQPDSAIYYYKAGYKWAQENDLDINLVSYYEGIGDAYQQKGEFKKASEARKSLVTKIRENAEKAQREKIAELETKYSTQKKDIAIENLQKTNALNSKIILQQRWLIGIVVLFLLAAAFIFYFIYNRRLLKEKNERLAYSNKHLILAQKVQQMQLNPHFIYNAISNMQGLIATDKKESANRYLVKLSRLIRNILELNRQEKITLRAEIEALENYLQLQNIRFDNLFDYSITHDDMDVEECMIPPMLVQPFVENSIQHGFQNIDYKGHIAIRFQQKGEQLHVTIDDNGRGRTSPNQNGKKSLSTTIIKERLDLLFNQFGEQKAYFKSYPKNRSDESGYVVELVLPLILK